MKLIAINNYGAVVHKPLASSVDNFVSICGLQRRTIGLDPDISVAAALYQVPRVASARGLSQDVVQKLVMDHVQGRFLWIFGEQHVNVLDLNLALDALK